MGRKKIRLEKENREIVGTFRKRVELCLALFLAAMMLLVFRLYYVQISCHESFERVAKSRYEILISGFGSECNFYYIIEKSKIDAMLTEALEKAGAEDITKESSRYSVYEMKNYDPGLNEKLRKDYGAYAFRNYAFKSYALGNDAFGTAQGNTGNENNENKLKVIVYADASGKLIQGISPKIPGLT